MNQATADYRPMWAALGLDLDKHDVLLGALGEAYRTAFLGQPNRPKGMQYFDFVMSEVHGLRVKELVDAREAGRIVVGSFCVFVPEELILAVDGISVGLCAGAEFGTDAAEQFLPRNTCALVKSAFGLTLEKVCPYVAASDLVVGENTCDGKKKSYETYAGLVQRFYAMDMPQTKSAAGRALLAAEYRRFVAELEQLSGKPIEADALRRAIETVNAKRSAMHRLASLRRARPAPISGLDALLANQVYFYDDPVRFTQSVHALCDELGQRVDRGEGVADASTPRILISGCPMAMPNWKLSGIVESAGAVIVGEESCVGERGTQHLVATEGADVNALIDAIVDRYFQIDCAIFTPNPSRLAHIEEMATAYGADGVIHYALQFCTPYQMEAGPIAQAVKAEGLPVLAIDTDYGTGDAGQLQTRVEAFLERIRRS
jgi:benzoyl-CoA reductase/2-hydroxyglutaryl-CoA dehydratase subunit BcrC/BadD/HgdB